jgi:short-subunit dehydrogenase
MKPMSFRGKWVLVTGAASGLGRAMAHVLAFDHGAHIVAVDRQAEELDRLRQQLERDAGVAVRTVVADLSGSTGVEDALREVRQGAPLYAAILNAGLTHFGDYRELGWRDFQAMLEVNVVSSVRMTTELVDRIEQSGQEGGVMLIASMAGLTPVPYQTVYSSTKAFLVHFGCGLWHELQGRRVSITTYAPGGIDTPMTSGPRFRRLSAWNDRAELVARKGIDALRARECLHVPGILNRIGMQLLRTLPLPVATGRVGSVYRRALEFAEQCA